MKDQPVSDRGGPPMPTESQRDQEGKLGFVVLPTKGATRQTLGTFVGDARVQR